MRVCRYITKMFSVKVELNGTGKPSSHHIYMKKGNFLNFSWLIYNVTCKRKSVCLHWILINYKKKRNVFKEEVKKDRDKKRTRDTWKRWWKQKRYSLTKKKVNPKICIKDIIECQEWNINKTPLFNIFISWQMIMTLWSLFDVPYIVEHFNGIIMPVKV